MVRGGSAPLFKMSVSTLNEPVVAKQKGSLCNIKDRPLKWEHLNNFLSFIRPWVQLIRWSRTATKYSNRGVGSAQMQDSYGAFVLSYICSRNPIGTAISSVDSHFSNTVHEVRKIYGSVGEPLAPSCTCDLVLR
jgi:hypothetical protein